MMWCRKQLFINYQKKTENEPPHFSYIRCSMLLRCISKAITGGIIKHLITSENGNQ